MPVGGGVIVSSLVAHLLFLDFRYALALQRQHARRRFMRGPKAEFECQVLKCARRQGNAAPILQHPTSG